MSGKTKGQLIVAVFCVLYWIALPAALYLLAGSQGLIVFAVLSLAAVGGTALGFGRADRA